MVAGVRCGIRQSLYTPGGSLVPRPGGERSVRTTRRRPAANADSGPAGPEFERRIRQDAALGDLDLDLAGAFLKPTPVGG